MVGKYQNNTSELFQGLSLQLNQINIFENHCNSICFKKGPGKDKDAMKLSIGCASSIEIFFALLRSRFKEIPFRGSKARDFIILEYILLNFEALKSQPIELINLIYSSHKIDQFQPDIKKNHARSFALNLFNLKQTSSNTPSLILNQIDTTYQKHVEKIKALIKAKNVKILCDSYYLTGLMDGDRSFLIKLS